MQAKILILSLISSLFFCFNSFSQERIEINKESYFVYPHKKSNTISWAFVLGVNKKSRENKELLFKKLFPEMNLEEEFVEENYKYFEEEYLLNNSAKINSKSLAYIRSNSLKFYPIEFNLHKTVTPSLDPIPDGKYVQVYDKIFQLDSKGDLTVDENQVASVFEIKNNLIEGFSYSLSPNGDTIEKGNYKNGKRIGSWEFKANDVFNINPNEITKDIVFEYVKCNYVEGIIEGEYEEYREGKLIFKGFYEAGEPSGEWFVYVNDYIFENEKDLIGKNVYYLKNHYTHISSDTTKRKISHKQVIRNIPFQNIISDSFNIPTNVYQTFVDFNKLYKFHKIIEEDLELPEEKTNAYEGEVYNETIVTQNYIVGADGVIWSNYKPYPKSKFIDSIGIEFLYDGIYEEFYSNGQKKFNYVFKEGELLREDTLFWDNGMIANVIEINSKNKYIQSFYDYDGKLIKQDVYDSLGLFEKVLLDNTEKNKIKIENYETKYFKDLDLYEYECYDTLTKVINDKLVFYKAWYGNKNPMAEISFDPNKREAQIKVNSLNQTPKSEVVYSFGEDYKFFSSNAFVKFKNLKTVVKSNGSFQGKSMNDSIPHAKIFDLNQAYEITNDYELFYNEKPFSGDFELNLNKKAFSYKFKENSLKLNFVNKSKDKKLKKEIDNYLKTGKENKNDLFDMIESTTNYQKNFTEIFNTLNDLNISNPYFDDLYYNDDENLKPNKLIPISDKVFGQYENGKANGKWFVLDQFGKIRIEINYSKGEKNGIVKYFNYAFPTSKNPYDEMNYEDPILEYPDKVTYFLEHEQSFKNGIMDGDERFYDWKGNITYSGRYKNGFLDGEIKEINKFVTSTSLYEEGLLDGVSHVKLSLPNKDTIVLFELNFQNHQLQGESKSYHANGKIAKRGFFLNGEPIEDYEAYDSLGVKYHYVKFLYTFPIEEKIWEENELSVKYEFDWRDSIYFRPEDLVYIPSAYDLFYEYGLIDDQNLEQAYFGRPSIVDKTGIRYKVTKYFPDQQIARDGTIEKGKKVECWTYNNYDGVKIYEIDYFDTILKINDSIKFKSKGIRSDFDLKGNLLHKSYVIEKIENYDCSHTDHYELRQFYTIWQCHDSIKRMNDYVKNYYDNGTIQSEGNVKNGLPTGVWKFYTPNGMLNQVGEYVSGKRNGRWLTGDLSKTKYLGDICMNPNLPDLEKRIEYQENLLDIQIRYFKLGKIQKVESYDINLNLKK
jgi:antitoxin component YwqK of YwqJK toxin-antitoxin module